jgi:metal-responsive CopG/Arc/MetJ family transcriptional regulator
MKRTTISLPDDLAATVEREAHRLHSSVSEIVRTALAAHFHVDQPRRLPFESLGASGHRNTARDMEEILAREWADAIYRDR